jgi:hypothetical protein
VAAEWKRADPVAAMQMQEKSIKCWSHVPISKSKKPTVKKAKKNTENVDIFRPFN